MHVTVKKWGNSASVRIPVAIMEAASLSVNQTVEMHEENGRVVIAPLPTNPNSLAEMLKRITPHNLHTEIDFGPPVGKEKW